jgi:hypothetical protein
MFVRALAGTVLILALIVSPASATAIHGRGPGAEASMDATLIFAGAGHRVQVLTQLCENPDRIRRCSSFPLRLRGAIEDAMDRPITWVDDRRVRGPDFWVFAPVAFARDSASARMAWWASGALVFGCRGGANLTFRRIHGAWSPVGGTGWEGCVD